MTKILIFAGAKQSGKSSGANFVAGYMLTQLGRRGHPFCPTQFSINDLGKLIVNTSIIDAEGKVELTNGFLDLNSRNPDFIAWALNIMWPNVKLYSYADTLKNIAINVFGMPEELVYGSEEDKRSLTHIKWKDMCAFLPPKHVSELKRGGKYEQKMTIREFLQYFGTNICRKLYSDCWVNNCLQNIFEDGSDLAIIQDARFANEIKIARKLGAKIIKLERKIDEDTHESENGLKTLNSTSYDLIIDNQYMTIKEKNQVILDALYEWGWLSGHIGLEV